MDSNTRHLDPANRPALANSLASAPASSGPLAAAGSTHLHLPALTNANLAALADTLRQRYPNAVPLSLIGLGALLFFSRPNYAYVVGAAVPFALGLVFLYAYFAQRNARGLLIPGAILTGLGVGSMAAALTGLGGLIAVGLGLGFCAIWYMARAHWWALVPGSMIALIGAAVVAANGALYGLALPMAFVLMGLWLLLYRWRTTARRS